MKKLFLLLITLNLFQPYLFAQNKVLDSLKRELENIKEDTARFRMYEAITVYNHLIFGKPMLVLANKILLKTTNAKERENILKAKALEYRYLSNYYLLEGINSQSNAIDCLQKALSIYKDIKDDEGITRVLSSLAGIYNNFGNVFKALETFKQGLSYSQQANYKKGIFSFTSSIGFLYAKQGDSIHVLDYIEKLLELEAETEDYTLKVEGISMAGLLYSKINNNEKALEYYYKAIPYYETSKDTVGLVNIYQNIGIVYKDEGNLPKVLDNFLKSIDLGQKIKFLRVTTWILVGEIYGLQGQFSKEIEWHQKAVSRFTGSAYFKGITLFALAKDYVPIHIMTV